MTFPTSAVKRLSFALLALLTIIMAITTFTEHWHCPFWNAESVYHSTWFAVLWGFTALLGMISLTTTCPIHSVSDFYRKGHLWFLHASFLLILSGAALTALTAQSGRLHLRTGVEECAYVPEGHAIYDPERLPFTVELQNFSVHYHPGTHSASNYISVLCIDHRDTVSVSMNQVATVDGWRFYQQAFDADGKGTTLSVRRDVWGLPITYCGYTLLFVSLVWMLLSSHGGFRKSLRQLRAPLFGVSLLMSLTSTAQTSSKATFHNSAEVAAVSATSKPSVPRTLSPETAEAFGRLLVAYGGRICPVETLANDLCLKIFGKTNYAGFTAEQIICGWIFWPDDWNEQPIVHLKNEALCKALHTQAYTSYNSLVSSHEQMLAYGDSMQDEHSIPYSRLTPYLGTNDAKGRAAAETTESLQLITALQRTDLLLLFPLTAQRTIWFSATDSLSLAASANQADRQFIQTIFQRMKNAAQYADTIALAQCITDIATYQERAAHHTLPSLGIRRAEHLYNKFTNLPVYLSRGYLLLGLTVFLLSLYAPWFKHSGWLFGIGNFGFLALTLYLGLRTFVSARLPLGNGHEIMLFASWFSLLAGILLRLRRFAANLAPLHGMPYIASGFFLLVASFSLSGTSISQLVPVLQSPLLSLHVSLIMLAYALLSFTFLLSVVALFRRSEANIYRLYTQLLLYPALSLLAAGIFIGAIWANNSWGRYWGWDPKEVWALITLLVYAFPLHSGSMPLFRRSRPFFIYLLFAFTTVLMTYFGVNYLLGGLHSYA